MTFRPGRRDGIDPSSGAGLAITRGIGETRPGVKCDLGDRRDAYTNFARPAPPRKWSVPALAPPRGATVPACTCGHESERHGPARGCSRAAPCLRWGPPPRPAPRPPRPPPRRCSPSARTTPRTGGTRSRPRARPTWEILPQAAGPGEVIVSKRHELGLLSNFAPTPFTFRGQRYASLEGFWQMMLYPDGPDDPRATVPRPGLGAHARAGGADDGVRGQGGGHARRSATCRRWGSTGCRSRASVSTTGRERPGRALRADRRPRRGRRCGRIPRSRACCSRPATWC